MFRLFVLKKEMTRTKQTKPDFLEIFLQTKQEKLEWFKSVRRGDYK